METASAADLFERYHLPVYRYFRRMIRRPDVAEDLTQELFLRVVRGLPRYRPMGREAAWVFQIARNVLAEFRRQRGTDYVGIEQAGRLATESHQVLAFGLGEALDLLPEADREMVLLREVVGLTYLEIAETCSTTTEAVRSRLYRARGQLQEYLAGTRTTRLKSLSREPS